MEWRGPVPREMRAVGSQLVTCASELNGRAMGGGNASHARTEESPRRARFAALPALVLAVRLAGFNDYFWPGRESPCWTRRGIIRGQMVAEATSPSVWIWAGNWLSGLTRGG
jgi:hypothetical protein